MGEGVEFLKKPDKLHERKDFSHKGSWQGDRNPLFYLALWRDQRGMFSREDKGSIQGKKTPILGNLFLVLLRGPGKPSGL